MAYLIVAQKKKKVLGTHEYDELTSINSVEPSLKSHPFLVTLYV